MVSALVPLRQRVADMMNDHWRSPGYTCPSAEVYPWLWLWDSCFHALIWAELGDADRALRELETVFVGQDDSGFVPHMGYFGEPEAGTEFWGRSGFSSISQPPMFGHAVAELHRRGVAVPESLVQRAISGVLSFDQRTRSSEGLIHMVHPWETGADDSPRWDALLGGGYSLDGWKELKGGLLETIERGECDQPIHNPRCEVAPISLNALVAFNARELAEVSTTERLGEFADELSSAISTRWNPELKTWVDGGALAQTSGRVRTAEALFGLLVDHGPLDDVCDELVSTTAFGGDYGPAGVHQEEPTFDADQYWRGPAWPQISYLLWVATKRGGRDDVADLIASQATNAADRELAEYWNPLTGVGGGAIPQSWTGLAVVMEPTAGHRPG